MVVNLRTLLLIFQLVLATAMIFSPGVSIFFDLPTRHRRRCARGAKDHVGAPESAGWLHIADHRQDHRCHQQVRKTEEL